MNKIKQLEELQKCISDPIYFMRTYLEIQHPDRGRIPFDLFPYQEDIINKILENRFNIVLKSRQLGLSTVVSAFCLWMAVFHQDKTILLIADNFRGSKMMLSKIKIAWMGLPKWMLEILDIETPAIESASELKLKNGSLMVALPTTEHTGRGYAASLVIVDEAAINDKLDEGWKAIYSTTQAGGGKMVVFSTPRGNSNIFYKLYQDSLNGKNTFVRTELPWNVHPEHNQKWFDEETKNMDDRQIAQEMLCVGPQTNIVTIDGCKKAEHIKIGDLVLTHEGRYRKVLHVQSRQLKNDEELYEISLPGNRQNKFFMTGNHPVLSYKYEIKIVNKIKTETDMNIIKPEFIRLDEILKYKNKSSKKVFGVMQPKLLLNKNIEIKNIDLSTLIPCASIDDKYCSYYRQKKVKSLGTKRFIKEDYNLGYWLGLTVAEGCINKRYNKNKVKIESLQLAFRSSKELDTLGKWLSNFYDNSNIGYKLNVRDYSDCFIITTNNKFLIQLYRNYVNEGYATTRTLKLDKFLNAPIEFIKGYIAGHYAGDGDHYIDQNNNGNKLKLVSRNDNLLFQVRTLLSHWGLYPRMGCVKDVPTYLELDGLKNRYKTIEDLLNDDKLDLRLACSKTRLVNNHIIGQFQTKLIKDHSVIPCVYDIQVEEDKSFIAQGLVLHNCDFGGSGNTFFNTNTLDWLREIQMPPVAYNGPNSANSTDMWIWKTPEEGKEYLISSDCARGDADDFSTFYVFDIKGCEVVAEYKGKIAPDKFADFLYKVGEQYNTAMIIQEKNSVGIGTAIRLRDLNYPKLYWEKYSQDDLLYLPDEEKQFALPGFTTKGGNKPGNRDEILNMLEEALRNKKLMIKSKRLIEESTTFIVSNKKASAAKGKNDDLIMALALGCWFIKPNGSFGGSIDSENSNSEWNKAFLQTISNNNGNVVKQTMYGESFKLYNNGPQRTYQGKPIPVGVRYEDVALNDMYNRMFNWLK